MTQVVEAADNVYRVKFDRDRALESCEIYLLRGDLGSIIESGPSSVSYEVLGAIRFLGWDRDDIAYIIPTHLHLDHAGGAANLAMELPNARVLAHQRGARHLVDPTKLIASTRRVYGDNFEERHGEILPVPSDGVLTVQGGEILNLGGRDLEIYHTPGHAPHHIAILDGKTRGLFCGDALGEYFPKVDVYTPPAALPVFAVDQAKETLRLIRRLGPSMLIFSHGGVRKDVESIMGLVEQTIDDLSALACDALVQGLDAKQLSKRLMGYQAKVMEVMTRPDIPMNVRVALQGKYLQVAKGLLAYHARK